MTSPANHVPRKSVAIVGTGSAGVGALWALNRTHHDVYVYEASDRLGGHTNTATWKRGKYQALVDTGFIVLNTATYREHPVPNMLCLTNTPAQQILSTFLRRLMSRRCPPR
jgi:predicted NAD/FAD-binding protein